MGQAKNRGSFEVRRALAIGAGRVKRRKSAADSSELAGFMGLFGAWMMSRRKQAGGK
jgi:hypothetical protein